MLEEVAAQLEDDSLAHAREGEPGRGAEDPGSGVDADVGKDDEQEPLLVATADPVVDRVADEVPADHRRGRREGGEHADQGEPSALVLRVREES